MNKLLCILLAVALTGCFPLKNKRNELKLETFETNTSSYRFSVSFISIGSGIDIKAKQQYDQFIKQFGIKNNIELSYEKVLWGKEGECDYCFKLLELDRNQQETFIFETKETLKSSNLIRYKENSNCGKKN